MKAVQLTLIGRVQGVGVRYWSVRKARELGLNGWVRNEVDRCRVRVWIEGEDAAVDSFVALCQVPWVSGRPGSFESVGVLAVLPAGVSDFEVRWR
ncbi:MAG: acylphosphatase [Propionibacteriaceae bacterium]|nr:acylphosphatase [Propionibacteriaceae bacterium]